MKKGWLILEKAFASIQLLFSILFSYLTYDAIMEEQKFMADENEFIDGVKQLPRFHISFHGHHIAYLLVLLFFLGGILLLFNKKTGWLISFSIWLSFFFFLIIFIIFKALPVGSDRIQAACVFLFVIAMTVFLAMKPILTKYQIHTKHWMGVASITILLLTDYSWKLIF